MIYDNNAFGIQADGNITNLIATHDNGNEVSSNNVKEFAAAVGVTPARIYEIIRESKYTESYLNSQRLKNGWFVQAMTKERADYLYTPII